MAENKWVTGVNKPYECGHGTLLKTDDGAHLAVAATSCEFWGRGIPSARASCEMCFCW